MTVWLEGVEGASLSGVQVFKTWENLREYWRLNINVSDALLTSLDEDVRRLMNGTAIFAEVGFYIQGDYGAIHYCARPVVVDDWYETPADHVEALKGVRFTRDEIEEARGILNTVEQVLNKEENYDNQ